MKSILIIMTVLFLTAPAFAQTDWNNDPGAAWNSNTADRYNQQNQMQEQQARQDEQLREQREETERRQEQIQQEQDRFNSMSPAEHLTYGHL